MQSKGSVCKYKRVDFFLMEKSLSWLARNGKQTKAEGWKEDKKTLTDFEPEEKGQEKL
jgi:hypothetical protein